MDTRLSFCLGWTEVIKVFMVSLFRKISNLEFFPQAICSRQTKYEEFIGRKIWYGLQFEKQLHRVFGM